MSITKRRDDGYLITEDWWREEFGHNFVACTPTIDVFFDQGLVHVDIDTVCINCAIVVVALPRVRTRGELRMLLALLGWEGEA